jgi:hypothetical protein
MAEAKSTEREAVQSRADVIHLLTLCEIRHFQQQRLHDFKGYMQAYLQAQVDFHEQVCGGDGLSFIRVAWLAMPTDH